MRNNLKKCLLIFWMLFAPGAFCMDWTSDSVDNDDGPTCICDSYGALQGERDDEMYYRFQRFCIDEPGDVLSKRIAQWLLNNIGQPQNESDLCQAVIKQPSNKTRNLYKAIIQLRYQGFNIIHDEENRTYTLERGTRKKTEGCYKKKLWELLENPVLLACDDLDLSMLLSDMGYNPITSGVEAIKTLKKFLSPLTYTAKVFQRRKALWTIVLQENRLRCISYYSEHAAIMKDWKGYVNKSDMSCISQCWDFYRDLFVPDVSESTHVQKKLMKYFIQHKEGVTTQEVAVFLQEVQSGPVDVWGCIHTLMCCGSVMCLDYRDGVFFWTEETVRLIVEQKGVLEDICHVVQECVLSQKKVVVDEILFSLYKRRYFWMKKQDVQALLDGLVATDRIAQCPEEYCALKEAWLETQQGEKQVASLPASMQERIEQLRIWKTQGILSKIQRKDPIDIISVLKFQEMKSNRNAQASSKRLLSSEEERQDNPDGFEQAGSLRREFYESAEWVKANPQAVDDRRKIIADYLTQNKEKWVLEKDLLKKFYTSTEDSEDLLQDVVVLIHEGKNIQYKGTAYKMFLQDFSVLSQDKEEGLQSFLKLSENESFQRLSVVRQAYGLCEIGHRDIPMSTVALYGVLSSEPDVHRAPENVRRMIALKDKGFEEKKIFSNHKFYKKSFGPLGQVRKEDVRIVKKSLRLYKAGRILLKLSRKGVRRGEHQHDAVLKCLESFSGQSCSAKQLQVVANPLQIQNRQRDLVRAIVFLRRQGKNIVHDCDENTFTLCPGERLKREGCYKKYLWDMLYKHPEMKVINAFLCLSDLGFDPIWSDVASISEIRKFLLCDDQSASQRFINRKNLWKTVIGANVWHSGPYYKKNRVIPQNMLSKDVAMVKRCWILYNESVLPMLNDSAEKGEDLGGFMQGVVRCFSQPFVSDPQYSFAKECA